MTQVLNLNKNLLSQKRSIISKRKPIELQNKSAERRVHSWPKLEKKPFTPAKSLEKPVRYSSHNNSNTCSSALLSWMAPAKSRIRKMSREERSRTKVAKRRRSSRKTTIESRQNAKESLKRWSADDFIPLHFVIHLKSVFLTTSNFKINKYGSSKHQNRHRLFLCLFYRTPRFLFFSSVNQQAIKTNGPHSLHPPRRYRHFLRSTCPYGHAPLFRSSLYHSSHSLLEMQRRSQGLLPHG